MFPESQLPERIGGYQVLRRLPGSQVAEVYLGRSVGPRGFQREVALKLMPDISDGNLEFVEDLSREASICARLNHPAIVRFFDFFEHEGNLVLVLEHVEGLTLEQIAAEGVGVGDAGALYVGHRVAAALAEAHAATDAEGQPTPIIHRNLSPENVVVGVDGEVRLTGFGIGKILGRTPDTAVGMVKGTPGFMAPEQVRGEPVTPKVDVYGLGILLWSMLTTRRPPMDGTPPARLATMRKDLPREVLAVVDAALDRFPASRKISAREIDQWLGKAASPSKAKAELKERVAAARTRIRESSPDGGAFPSGGSGVRLSANVRYGAAAESTSVAPATTDREPSRPDAHAGALFDVVRNLPPPRPVAATPRVPEVGILPAVVITGEPRGLGSTAIAAPSAPSAPQAGDPQATPAASGYEAHGAANSGAPTGNGLGRTVPTQILHFGAPAIPGPIPGAPAMALAPSFGPPAVAQPSFAPQPPVPPSGGSIPSLPVQPSFSQVPLGPGVSFGPVPAPPSSAAGPVASGVTQGFAADAELSDRLRRRRAPLPMVVTVIVSSLTASLVAVVALYLFTRHDGPSPASAQPSAVDASQPALAAATAIPAAIPSASKADSPVAATDPDRSAATGREPVRAAPPDPTDLPYGYGQLTALFAKPADVYVQGKRAGEVNQPLKVHCGRAFVRLASPGGGKYPEWITQGKATAVACQHATQVEFGKDP